MLAEARDGAWWRTHRALLIALALSVLLHVLASVGKLVSIDITKRPEDISFNAVLTPLAVADPATAVDVNPVPATARAKPARLRAPRRPPAPKSEADFAAPENAIAVGRAVPDGGGATAASAAESFTTVAETPAAIADSTVPVAAEPAPMATEQRAPRDIPTVLAEAPPAVELPGRVSIAYKATTSVADGVAHYKWKREGEKYEFASTIQAEGFFVNLFAGTLTQQSTGTISATGLEPALFSIRRGEKEPDTAEFQRDLQQVRLSRGSQSRLVPMPPNLQDTQSFLFQLAFEAPKLKTAEDRLTILVTNGRGLNRYTFRKVDEPPLETRIGTLETVHLVRETSELRDSYEVWLSPKHHYLPVKLKFFVDRFPAELIATNITSTP